MKSIILFDGVCHLCNRSVQFIIQRDPNGRFQFASLQSMAAREFLGSSNKDLDTIVLIEQGKIYKKSTAVLRICRHLKGLWKIFIIFYIIPKSLRDLLYDYVARHRYQWFGHEESCPLPTPEQRKRFL